RNSRLGVQVPPGALMNPKFIAITSGLLAMTGWGLTDIFAKKAIDKIGHQRIAIYTSIPALVISGVLVAINLDQIQLNFGQLLFYALLGLADLFAYLMLYKAYTVGKVSIINPISSAYTIPALLISILIFREPLNTIQGLFMSFIIIGVIVTAIDFRELKDGFQEKDFVKGLPQGILAALTWGVIFPLFDLAVNNNPWYLVSFILTASKILLLIFYNRFILNQKISIEEKSLLKPLFWAGVTDGGANLAISWGYALSTFTSITTVISSAYPLLLVPLAAIVLKEKNSPNQYFGVGMITLGIIALSFV
ncbi:DMT family transporter, partial [Patescibacteria group bacterium]|nr:DMT family transporter [Patescibacteria group bacterium]